jgi:two-component system sensor histidine kinase GlrK
VTVSADAKKLGVIVDNVLSNAIKFSPSGGEVKLTVAQEGDDVVLDVHDSGPGVSAADKERVFEPFYRGGAARDSRIKGTGLGLSIVREYVAAHGGSVHVVDAGSRGGHLRVMLPRAQSQMQAG